MKKFVGTVLIAVCLITASGCGSEAGKTAMPAGNEKTSATQKADPILTGSGEDGGRTLYNESLGGYNITGFRRIEVGDVGSLPADNADMLGSGDDSVLPIKKIKSRAELDEYVSCLPENFAHQQNELLEKYDESFFEDHMLAVVNTAVESGAIGYFPHGVNSDSQRSTFVIARTVPFILSDDMTSWLLLFEIDKRASQDLDFNAKAVTFNPLDIDEVDTDGLRARAPGCFTLDASGGLTVYVTKIAANSYTYWLPDGTADSDGNLHLYPFSYKEVNAVLQTYGRIEMEVNTEYHLLTIETVSYPVSSYMGFSAEADDEKLSAMFYGARSSHSNKYIIGCTLYSSPEK